MVERLRIAVLFVSDSEHDVTGAVRELRRAGFAPIWQSVDSPSPLWRALENRHWDFVISDTSLSQLDVFDVLALTRELAPSTSFVVLSECIQEEMAVDILRAGASDFVTKANLSRLSTAIKRELARPTLRARTPGVAAMLVTAQETESRRIARHLHDGLGQLLAALARTLDDGQLDVARALNDDAIRAVREISTELWPTILDDLGLPPALRWLAERYANRVGFSVRVELDEIGRLPAAVEAASFRIAEAALANVVSHADARDVVIRLRQNDDDLELEIIDDGQGFDPDAAWLRAARGMSLGLPAMRERATLAGGTFVLATAPREGTTVRVHFPLAGS